MSQVYLSFTTFNFSVYTFFPKFKICLLIFIVSITRVTNFFATEHVHLKNLLLINPVYLNPIE